MRTGLAACVLLAAVSAGTAVASTRNPAALLTLAGEAGEHEVEVHDFRFVYFLTSYRHTRADPDETPTGERVEIVQTRDECRCVRLADWSSIKVSKIREIAISYPPGQRVASVRVTRKSGRVNEYPATDLYGGDGLTPPMFSATIDGTHREFPLILDARPGSAWPDERLVRVLFVRSAPPPPRGHHH
jgi:hypothetical protein